MAADLSAAALLYRSGIAKDYPLSGSEASVGYDRGNEVRIPVEGVSRRHAKITFDGKDYWIEDAGSSNGTFLNGSPVVRRERLRHLDVVSFGRRTDLLFVRKYVRQARSRRRGILSAWLEAIDGPEAGDRREIPKGSITFGRAPANNVVVDSQLVSKSHARLERSGIELILTDLQSANGTFVEGVQITSKVLQDGDELTLGKARTFRVRIEEGEIETSEVVPKSSVFSMVAGLPMDWKTRMEWTPEEKAVFERFRSEAQAPKPAPTAKPAAKPKPEGTPKPPPPKREAPPKEGPPAKPQPIPKPESGAKPRPAAEGPARREAQLSAVPPPVASAAPVAAGAKREAVALAPPAAPAAAPAAAPPSTVGALQVALEGKFQSFTVGGGDHDVGRVPECAIRIESPQISRRHAVLHVAGSEVAIEDLQSANGTLVNGKRITGRRLLADGDVVQFGDLGFRVRLG